MPQNATETASTTDELFKAFEKAKRVRATAAAQLAYDVTFRAEEPYMGQHQRPSDALTTQLKADYRAACAAVDAAFDAWYVRTNATF